MSIPQLNLPRKHVVFVKALAGVLLVILALLFSFGPILSVNSDETAELAADTEEFLNEFFEDIELDRATTNEIMDLIESGTEITMPKLVYANIIGIKSFILAIDLIRDDPDVEKRASEIKSMVESDNGVQSMAMLMILCTQVVGTDTFDLLFEEDTEFSTADIVMIVLRVILAVVLCFLVMLIPIILLISALVIFISFLKNIKSDLNRTIQRASNRLLWCLSMGILFTMILCLFPADSLAWGSGMKAMFAIAIVGLVLNTIASRLCAYKPGDFACVNAVQGMSLITLLGGVLYFIGATRASVTYKFAQYFTNYTATLVEQEAKINEAISRNNMRNNLHQSDFSCDWGNVSIDLILVLLYAMLVLTITLTIISQACQNVSLSGDKKTQKCAYIRIGITALIPPALVLVLSHIENAVAYSYSQSLSLDNPKILVEEYTLGTIFQSDIDSQVGMIFMFAGAALVLAAGIALSILKKSFCASVDEAAILQGYAETVDSTALILMPEKAQEPATEEEPVAEEPAAEEPAAEEPAAEEPAVEETAVEEPAVEEPATEEPATEEPATEEPATEEPATEEPAVEEPAVEEPAVEEPAAESTPSDSTNADA